jgi:hypothetical protein
VSRSVSVSAALPDFSSFLCPKEKEKFWIEGGPLWPEGENKFIADAVSSFHINLFIYKTPIDPSHFSDIMEIYRGGPDLILPSSTGRPRFFIDIKSQALGTAGTEVFKTGLWKSDDKITSILDLAGSQIFLPLGRIKEQCSSKADQIIIAMMPLVVMLDLGGGRVIQIPVNDLLRTELPNSCVVYSYVFPKGHDRLRSLWSAEPS